MKKVNMIALLSSAFLLGACGSKSDANEKNFGQAIEKYYEKNDELCLNEFLKGWPVEVSEWELSNKSANDRKFIQLATLEKLGLVQSQDVEVESKAFWNGTSKKEKIRRYSLTAKGKPFAKEVLSSKYFFDSKGSRMVTYLCWGSISLDKVVKWEGPLKLGDYQEASVIYTYQLSDIADWAKIPELQTAFPSVQEKIDGEKSEELTRSVKLTSEGWETRHL